MKISLIDAGKKYYREWIFRRVNATFLAEDKTVILGSNGSGKSTLLQIIAGAVIPNEGVVIYNNGKEISPDDIYQHISFASPYLELIEEFTLSEIINFHFKFKKPLPGLSEMDILKISGLNEKADTVFKYFSSGMKQRIKLSLAVLSDTDVLLLDEPCSNLDNNGIEWYKKMIEKYSSNRVVIVASNDFDEEYSFCKTRLNITDFKK